MQQKSKINKYTFIKYTLIMGAAILIIYGLVYFTGQSLVWKTDGIHQHYPIFIDYLNKIRSAISGNGFNLWDWQIGLGSDVIHSYGYYVIGDPFVYLGLLFPRAWSAFAYHFLIFVRIYATGIAFLLYARERRFTHRTALIGSLLVGLSHYNIYNAVRHPFFILPLIWFPLLAIGVEKILKKESGVLFAIMVAISAISNFYFFYKLTILIFIYAVCRFISISRNEDKWKKYLINSVSRSILYYTIGILISLVIFLPMATGFLAGARSSSGTFLNPFIYNLEYYGLFIINLFSPGTYYWTVGGMSIIVLFSLAFVFRKWRNYRGLALNILVLFIMLLMPFFGSLMNGLSSPYNRFTFVLPFYAALTMVVLIESKDKFTKKQLNWLKGILAVLSVVYIGAGIIQELTLVYLLPIIIGWTLYFVFARHQGNYKVVLSLMLINLVINALNFYLPHGKNALNETMAIGESDTFISETFGGLEGDLADNYGRVGVTSADNHVRNQHPILGVRGLSSYLSVTNGSVFEFADSLELNTRQVIQPVRNGMDDRRIPNYLMNVTDIISSQANEHLIPDTYDTEVEGDYVHATTDNAYPLAYLEDDYMSRSEFETLNPVQKEYVLTQGFVSDADLPLNEMEKPNEDYQIYNEENYQVTIQEEGETALNLDIPQDVSNHEIYVHFKGIDFELNQNYPLIRQDMGYRIQLDYGETSKSINQTDPYSFSSYFERENMLFNMGEVTNEDQIQVTFEDDGKYQIDEIVIYAVPLSNEQDNQVSKERENQALQINQIGADFIQGEIEAESDSVLVTSIPYADGWDVLIDDQKIDKVKANVGFIGIPVNQGQHTIRLEYRTPYLTAGIWGSVIGIVVLISVDIVRKNRKDKDDIKE